MNESLERRVRERAKDRCEYCKIPAYISEFTFPLDHIIAQQHRGQTTYENLALSCPHDNYHKGPNIAGEILPGGGDWLLTGSDGIGRVEARVTIRTDDNALISFTAGGLIQLPPDGFRRLAAGERLPFGETYARTTPKFETSDERYGWISTVVTIGYNLLSPDHVDYRVYKVL